MSNINLRFGLKFRAPSVFKIFIKLKDLKVNNDGFAFDSRTGNTYSINATGLLVINSIKTGATNSQIQDRMAEQFNVDLQTVGRDLEIFFNQLELNHLIQAKRLI